MAKELQPNIKVRLDRRTVITVRDGSKLAYWKEKFPGLEILKNPEAPVYSTKKATKWSPFLLLAIEVAMCLLGLLSPVSKGRRPIVRGLLGEAYPLCSG